MSILWTRADNLNVGDRLDAPNGASAVVGDSQHFMAMQVTYNVTIENTHLLRSATALPVLVHNCPASRPKDVPRDVKRALKGIYDNSGSVRSLNGKARHGGYILINPKTGEIGWLKGRDYDTVYTFDEGS